MWTFEILFLLGLQGEFSMAHAQKLPAEPNRLLLIHVMNDENVFFKHTSQLVDCLVVITKPCYRSTVVSDITRYYYSTRHYEATIMTFLK
ncbi:dipeptidyl peptidase 9-like [Dysidea avara]|uniref:dipeptidyl peptidase 9-like n=1 Tax=Dysidea avara TaxID=196820 RepID=UPI00332E9363